MNRRQEIEARLAAIIVEMDQEGADLDALEKEVRALKDELKTIDQAAERRRKLREDVTGGMGPTVRAFPTPAPETIPGTDTEEYRTAWLKHLRGQELTDLETRAFTSANGAISQLVVNDIMRIARDHAPLLQHVTVIPSAAKITYYVEGENVAAIDHTENAEIAPSADALAKVELNPAEIVKLIQISEAARQMSIPAFNTWLTTMLGEAIAVKITEKLVTVMTTAATSAGTTITAATVQALLGSVKGSGIYIVCNRKTLYTKLLPLQDNSKNSIVTFSGGAASVYGVPVMLDDNPADDTVLAGCMPKTVAAMGENVTVREQYDIKTNSYMYLGVALFDCKVAVASAYSKLAAAAG